MSPSDVIDLVPPYLDYLSAPIFILAVMAIADLMFSFAVDLIKKVKKGYKL